MKERTPVDAKFKWERTAGLHGQLTPRGFEGRIQYEATSPWGILPRYKSNTHIMEERGLHEIDSLEASKSTAKLSSEMLTSVQPTPSANNGAESTAPRQEQPAVQTADAGGLELSPREKSTNPSEESISTEKSPAMRRQSVNDLFNS
jgi:hypothetical protein